VRILPIVFTTLSPVGCLLPLAVHGQRVYEPLAWVIMGELISSTLLARIVTPVMYKVLPPPVV
jgi:multidrug efflux pump subunit AcrB